MHCFVELLCTILFIWSSRCNLHVPYFISEHTVHDLLEVLCSIDKTPREHLETQQACFKQFAQILDFVLKFDDTKVCYSNGLLKCNVFLSENI